MIVKPFQTYRMAYPGAGLKALVRRARIEVCR